MDNKSSLKKKKSNFSNGLMRSNCIVASKLCGLMPIIVFVFVFFCIVLYSEWL